MQSRCKVLGYRAIYLEFGKGFRNGEGGDRQKEATGIRYIIRTG